LCREQFLAGELKVVHSWTNPAPKTTPAAKHASHSHTDVHIHSEGVSWSQNGESASRVSGTTAQRWSDASQLPHHAAPTNLELDRAAERIETWLLEWLVARLALDPADVPRDRPFAEFGVDSLTAVELSQELEDEFKVPLPPIVAWNYPTPAALARYLAEQSLNPSSATSGSGANGAAPPTAAPATSAPHDPAVAQVDDSHLAGLLTEIENLSDEEVARMLAEEQSGK
jgi:acyl carrier protein